MPNPRLSGLLGRGFAVVFPRSTCPPQLLLATPLIPRGLFLIFFSLLFDHPRITNRMDADGRLVPSSLLSVLMWAIQLLSIIARGSRSPENDGTAIWIKRKLDMA
jgi:hypothetical protein